MLIREIVEQFRERFTPGGRPVYVGDAESKWNSFFKGEILQSLDISVDPHGPMPDVIVYSEEHRWLFLIEAVTSNGPVDATRHEQLRELFTSPKVGLVYVTAFLNRRALAAFIDDISWETEVWVADHPTHMIHFDGRRFLGPYSDA